MAEETEDNILEESDETSNDIKDDIDPNKGEDGSSSKLKALLSNKFVLIGAAVVLVIIIAAVSYFVFFSAEEEIPEPIEESEQLETSEQVSSEGNQLELPAIPETEVTVPEPVINSRLAQISAGVTNPSSGSGTDESDNANESESDSAEQTAEPLSEEQQEFLKKKVELLEEENKKLREQLEKLIIQVKLYKNAKRAETLSTPIEDLATDPSLLDAPIPGSDSPELGYYNDFSSDYSGSPYADDEATPMPSWGDNK